MIATDAFRLGVNYTPSRKWYFCWNDWDLAEIKSDLAQVAALGADHVRVQLIWSSFQPNPTVVSKAHLDHLSDLMKVCADLGMDVTPTLLTGFLSGWFFLPPFVNRKNLFTDSRAFQSEVYYALRVLDVLGKHDNFMALDLGNEINCHDHSLAPSAGDDWARRFMAAITPYAHGRPIVNGIDHTPLFAGSTFSAEHLACDYPVLSLHAWPMFTGCLARGDLSGAASLHIARFLLQLIRLYERGPGKPVWMQEFGACDLWGDLAQRSNYMENAIALARSAGATWFTWWCSHDKPCDMAFHEWKYSYGLLGHDNQRKPLADVFAQVAAKARAATPRAEAYDVELVVPADFQVKHLATLPQSQWIEQNLASSTWRLYDVYLQHLAQGRTPRLVRADWPQAPSAARVVLVADDLHRP